MRTYDIRPGDLVKIAKPNGQEFHAVFIGSTPRRRGGGVEVMPLDSRYTYRRATSVEVVGVWRATAATRRAYAASLGRELA